MKYHFMPTVTEILEGIREDVAEARLNFDVYRIYKDNRAKYWSVILTYDAFFSVSLRAHFVAMVAALGRVFDKDQRNISIPSLLKADPAFENLDPTLKKVDGFWYKNADALRHQFVAHHPGSRTAAQVFNVAGLTLYDIEDLISSCETLVDVWTRHARCHMHLLSDSKMDTLALLEALVPTAV